MEALVGTILIGEDGTRYRIVPEQPFQETPSINVDSLNSTMPIVEQIQLVMEKYNVSQKALAEKAGLTPAQMCRIIQKQGKRGPHLGSVNAIRFAILKIENGL